MQPSPLQLKYYLLADLQFTVSDDFKDVPAPAGYDVMEFIINVETNRIDEAPLRWRSELTIESKEAAGRRLPYGFRIKYVGFFEVVPQYPSDKVELMVRTNAPALLYSAARETLLTLTARGPVPALILPTVTFLQNQTDVEKSKSAERKQRVRRNLLRPRKRKRTTGNKK
ncbi:MAG: protein-export chaperone SecB [Acidobacteria bacterium]|nr:protein-export chaperone SecB [Acidobacteriota bacterium]